MDDLGKRIRAQRRKRSLTLKQLAEMTGLSIGFLSEIERGVSEPSMASLRKIRESLGVSLLSFRDSEDEHRENNSLLSILAGRSNGAERYIQDARVVRAGQRKKLAYPGRPGFYELLTPDLNRLLEVLYFKMEPDFDTGPEPITDPPGEKCMVILSGQIDFRVYDEVYHLEAGDSLSYPAMAPVGWKVGPHEEVEGILIVTPPGF